MLVTGGTGFLGRHLVRTLAEETDAALRLLSPRRPTAEDLPAAARAGAELVRGDLREPDEPAGACARRRYRLPRRRAGARTARPHAARRLPARQRRRDADAGDAGGRGGRAPLRVRLQHRRHGHAASPVVDETTPCRPTSPYEVTKRLAEEGLLELGARTGLEIVIVRPCLIAGEGQRGGPLLKLFRLCRRGLFPVFGGRLDVQEPLVDVEDVAHALILAATEGGPARSTWSPRACGTRWARCWRSRAGSPAIPRPISACRCPWRGRRPCWRHPLARLAGREPPLSPERLDLFLADRAIDIGKARRELGYRAALPRPALDAGAHLCLVRDERPAMTGPGR